MAFDAFPDLAQFASAFADPVLEKIVLAVIVIAAGILGAKVVALVIRLANRKTRLNRRTVRSLSRLLEVLVFIVSIIVALNMLEVNSAQVIIQSTLSLAPTAFTVILLLVLGYIVINLAVDMLKASLLKVGFEAYLNNIGLSAGIIDAAAVIAKVFLFIIVISASFTYVGFSIPFVDSILLSLIYGFIALSIGFAFVIFREPLQNFFAGIYIDKSILKRGQSIKIGEDYGEVIDISAQGVTVKLQTGYDIIVPNLNVLREKLYIKRTKQDVSELESVRKKFVCQLPAYCGPASASMMLGFMGYPADQEQVGRLAGTRMPGGTGPKKLIEAVGKATNNAVTGAIVRYDEISNLKEEAKAWLADGALLIMWFNKPAIFRGSKTRGHYVLCVGVEGDELIIMDPSKATAGVYLIDYRLLEDAMAEHDKKRGYIVFAARGTPAHWRISEGLIYTDIAAYKEISKSFERYIKRLMRKNETISDLISESVKRTLGGERGPRRLWKPELKKKKD